MHKIDYIVAPYEGNREMDRGNLVVLSLNGGLSSTSTADAQMAYLFRQGIVSCCITEDSDLLVFGCKVFLKMDK